MAFEFNKGLEEKKGFNFDSGNDISVEEDKSFLDKAGELGKTFLSSLISSEKKFGEKLGGVVVNTSQGGRMEDIEKGKIKNGDAWMKLANRTDDPAKKEKYTNLAKKQYEEAGRVMEDVLGKEWLETDAKEVAGIAGGVALDVATAGTYGAAAKTAKTGTLLKPIVQTSVPTVISKLSSTGVKEAAKKAAVGASVGYGYDVTGNLQNHEEGVNIVTPGFATLLGAGLPAFGYAFGAAKEALKGKSLETIVSKGIEKGIKPSVAGKKTISAIDEYAEKSRDAIKSIINNKQNLKLQNKYGEEIVGELPDTLDEFAESIKQTKKVIFDEYDALSKSASKTGNVVTFDKVIPELEKAANDTVLNLKDPSVAKYAADMIDRFKQVGSLTPEQTQQFITEMNADLQAFYRNPSYGSGTKVAIDAMIANNMRESLDNVIESATGKQYQKLKSLYGSLKAIEKDVNHRAIVNARKNENGLIDFTNIFTYGDIAAGMASGNLAQTTRGVLGKVLQSWYKYRNDPNVIIREMFKQGEKAIKKGNIVNKVPKEIVDNKSWINKMFPQEGKEAPKEVLNTIISKAKSLKAGMTVEDVSKKKLTTKVKSPSPIQIPKESPLVQEARKYKSAEEFINSLPVGGKGRANGKGEAFHFVENKKTLSELSPDELKEIGFSDGVLPKKITLYRGSQDKNLVPGDFLSLNRNMAGQYGGGNLKKLELSPSEITAAPGNSKTVFLYKGDVNKVKSQLAEIWNQSKSPSPIQTKNKKGSTNIKTLASLGVGSSAVVGAANALSGKRTVTINNEQPKQEVKGVETKKEDVNIGKTPDEKNKVIATIVAEAIGEGEEGLQASLNTVKNRAKEKGKTLYDVVSQPAQYSAFSSDNKIYSKVRDLLRGKPVLFANATEKQSVEKAVKKVKEMVEDSNLQDITDGATHYFNEKTMTDKSWMNEGKETKRIGNHVFKKGIRYK